MPDPDNKPVPPPFAFAFCVIPNGQREKWAGKVGATDAPALLTAWNRISKCAICFELPEEADVTARVASLVDTATISVVQWNDISRDRYEGVLYVRRGRLGQVYRFDRDYSAMDADAVENAHKRIRAVALDRQKRKDTEA